jgi:hypothetical protein
MYQRHVPEYWIADLDARLIERWIGGDDRPAVVTDWLLWHPSRAATPLTLDVRALRSILNT